MGPSASNSGNSKAAILGGMLGLAATDAACFIKFSISAGLSSHYFPHPEDFKTLRLPHTILMACFDVCSVPIDPILQQSSRRRRHLLVWRHSVGEYTSVLSAPGSIRALWQPAVNPLLASNSPPQYTQ